MKLVRRGQAFTFEGDEPPGEFQIFARGANDSTKGPALWDDAAIASVMARVAERGRVRYMMDLEHRAIDDETRARSSDATDAMAWFDVELRDGALWAVNVAWTPEGEARLRSKKQVYFSPAYYDDEQGRVLELVNVALTSLPATHDIPSLVAASRIARRSVSSSEVGRALDAALFDKFPRNDTDPSASAFICDVYPEYAVFEREGKLWQVPYTYANGAAAFTGEPVQVTRQYVPLGAAARRVAIAIAERRLARMQTSCQRKTRKP